MPAFDPSTTTIAEVARQAILPLTRWRPKLRFEILGITDAHWLQEFSVGAPGRFKCRFGSSEDSRAAGVHYFEDEWRWTLETDLDLFEAGVGLPLAILKETPSLEAEIARVSIPGAALARTGEAQTAPLIVDGCGFGDKVVCELRFRTTEVRPSLEGLYQQFHQPATPSDIGASFADWVSNRRIRSPARWVCTSSKGTRFVSLVASCVAHARGFGSYESVLGLLLKPESQQDVLVDLQGAHGGQLYWISPFCENLQAPDDQSIDVSVDPARCSSWAAACAKRRIPQMILLDHVEHFRPDTNFFRDVHEAKSFGVKQDLLAPNPEVMLDFFALLDRLSSMSGSDELTEASQSFRYLEEDLQSFPFLTSNYAEDEARLIMQL